MREPEGLGGVAGRLVCDGTSLARCRDAPVAACQVGRLIVIGDRAAAGRAGVTAVYARVLSAGQKAGLDRQGARVTAWAAVQGLAVGRVVTEAASALSGKGREFLALLRGEAVTVIVVEHRDRFGAGFGLDGRG